MVVPLPGTFRCERVEVEGVSINCARAGVGPPADAPEVIDAVAALDIVPTRHVLGNDPELWLRAMVPAHLGEGREKGSTPRRCGSTAVLRHTGRRRGDLRRLPGGRDDRPGARRRECGGGTADSVSDPRPVGGAEVRRASLRRTGRLAGVRVARAGSRGFRAGTSCRSRNPDRPWTPGGPSSPTPRLTRSPPADRTAVDGAANDLLVGGPALMISGWIRSSVPSTRRSPG
jgi:hypothetical protein